MGLGNGFLDMTRKAQATKAKMNHWDYIKIKKLLQSEENDNKMKRLYMELEIY